MNKQRFFILISLAFIAAMVVVTIDIFSRTSPPGSRKRLMETIDPLSDSLRGADSLVAPRPVL